ncbi:hypothetical protein TPAR_03364, partial [Tolypocladium paradoxum]
APAAVECFSSPTAVVTSTSNCSSAPHPRPSTSPPTHSLPSTTNPSSPGSFSFIPPLLPHSSPRLASPHQQATSSSHHQPRTAARALSTVIAIAAAVPPASKRLLGAVIARRPPHRCNSPPRFLAVPSLRDRIPPQLPLASSRSRLSSASFPPPRQVPDTSTTTVALWSSTARPERQIRPAAASSAALIANLVPTHLACPFAVAVTPLLPITLAPKGEQAASACLPAVLCLRCPISVAPLHSICRLSRHLVTSALLRAQPPASHSRKPPCAFVPLHTSTIPPNLCSTPTLRPSSSPLLPLAPGAASATGLQRPQRMHLASLPFDSGGIFTSACLMHA